MKKAPLTPLSDIPFDEQKFVLDFERLVLLLVFLHRAKARAYGDSWRRRGDAGVYHNLGRKWDRYEALNERWLRGNRISEDLGRSEGGESGIVAQAIDLAVYAIKDVTFKLSEQPELFYQWLGVEGVAGLKDFWTELGSHHHTDNYARFDEWFDKLIGDFRDRENSKFEEIERKLKEKQ